MNPFEALGTRQSSALAQVRSSVADNKDAVMLLLETSCLLEMARLVSATTDVGSYLASATYVVAAFVGTAPVALYVAPLGLDGPVLGSGLADPMSLLVRASDVPAGTSFGDEGLVAYGLPTDQGGVGFLAVIGLPKMFAGSNMLANLARQLGEGLNTVLANDRLRRQSATAQLTRLLNELTESYNEETLARFVKEIVYLDGVGGVELELESPHLGGQAAVSAGAAIDEAVFVHEDLIDARLPFRLRVGARPESDGEYRAGLKDIAEQIVASLSRVEETRRLRSEIETDPLTGVGNRRLADRALATAIARSERTGEAVAVLLLDLDHFKLINDTFGHNVGDNLLSAVSTGLAQSLRPSDTMARMGGEEFLMVCPGETTDGAVAIAARVLLEVPALAEAVLPATWRQTVSIGIAIFPADATTLEELLLRADQALYEAKRSGRDRWSTVGASR